MNTHKERFVNKGISIPDKITSKVGRVSLSGLFFLIYPKTSFATTEIDDGPLDASTIYVTFMTTHFM